MIATTAADRDAAAPAGREQRRGLHLHGERARGAPRIQALRPVLVEEVARDDRAGPRTRGAASQRIERRGVGVLALAGPERPAGAVGADRLRRDDQLAERERGLERPGGADADRALEAQRDQLLEHDHRGRAAHPGRLDRERRAVRRDAGVPPQSPVVVEHARRLQQLGGERERAARIAGEQRPRRERRGRVQVDRAGAHAPIIAVCDAVAMAGPVLEAVRAGGVIAPSDRVLALVSGGRDSVCLLDVLVEICGSGAVRVLHIDYGLRGEESAADARHVRELCARLNVQCTVERAPAAPEHGNLQAWARDLRYARATQLAGSALIATGHTASDEVETVLHRLASSPGRRALLGIAPREGRLVRPLLGVTRAQTAEHCVGRGLAWREDSSNEGGRFARGRIRHVVLPALKSVHPAAAENIGATVEVLRAESAVLDEVVEVALAGRSRIALAHLAALPGALARLVVIRLAEDAAGAPVPGVGGRVPELLELGAAGGSRVLDAGGGVRAVVEYGVLRFASARGRHDSPAPVAGELGLPGAFEFGAWELRATLEAAGAHTAARAAGPGEVGVLDADRLGARALTVRSWRAGDRMRPLGLAGSKSLADLFGARRVPREARASVPVVSAGEEIVWVPGVAVAERVRVDGDTRALAVLHAVRR